MKRTKKGNIEEVYCGKFGEFPLPPLTAVQRESYAQFLQQDKMPE